MIWLLTIVFIVIQVNADYYYVEDGFGGFESSTSSIILSPTSSLTDYTYFTLFDNTSTIISANVSVNGLYNNYTCYQTLANETECGSSGGAYSWTEGYCWNLIDDLFDLDPRSYAYNWASTSICFVWSNWSLPSNYLNNTDNYYYMSMDSFNPPYSPLSTNCILNPIQIRVNSTRVGGVHSEVWAHCYNGSDWQEIGWGNYTLIMKWYDEGFNWFLMNVTSDVHLFVNSSVDFVNDGWFNTTSTVDLNISEIQSLNDVCVGVGCEVNITVNQSFDVGSMNLSSLNIHYYNDANITDSTGQTSYNNTISDKKIFYLQVMHNINQSFNYSNFTHTFGSNFTIAINESFLIVNGKTSKQMKITITPNETTPNSYYTGQINLMRLNTSEIFLFPMYLTLTESNPLLYFENTSILSTSINDNDIIYFYRSINNSNTTCNNLSFFSTGNLDQYISLNISSIGLESYTPQFKLDSVPQGNYNEYLYLKCNDPVVPQSENSINLIVAVSSSSGSGGGGGGGGSVIISNVSLELFPGFLDTFYLYMPFLNDDLTFVKVVESNIDLRDCVSDLGLFDCEVTDKKQFEIRFTPFERNTLVHVVDDVIIVDSLNQRDRIPVRLVILNAATYIPLTSFGVGELSLFNTPFVFRSREVMGQSVVNGIFLLPIVVLLGIIGYLYYNKRGGS
jgi:hypothetical protein